MTLKWAVLGVLGRTHCGAEWRKRRVIIGDKIAEHLCGAGGVEGVHQIMQGLTCSPKVFGFSCEWKGESLEDFEQKTDMVWCRPFFFFFFYKFIYLFLAELGLRCCARAFSSCNEQWPLFVAVRGPLIGGAVVKNPPANAGDTGSSPGPGRSHIAAEQLSPCTTTTEPALWSPWATTTEARAPRAHAPQQEKLPQWLKPFKTRPIAAV